ncbi:MAG: sensory box protein [Burkholderiaceae bacterium]|nr:sensory box protein [Burkholderiaceae bacterium]
MLRRFFGRWLLLFVIASNLLFAIYSVISLIHSRKQTEHLAEVHVQNLAHAISQSISNYVDQVSQSARTIKYEMERQLMLGQPDLAFAGYQKIVMPEAIGTGIVNADGTVVMGQAGAAGTTSNVGNSDFFVFLKQSSGDRHAFSKPLVTTKPYSYGLTVGYRINHPDGRFAGIATANIDFDRIKQLLTVYDMGSNGALILRDRDLDMVLRYPFSKAKDNSGLGTTPPSAPLKSLIESGAPSGTYRAEAALDDVHRLFSYRKLPNAPLYIIAGLALDDYLAEWRRKLWETLAFLAIFAIVSGASSWMLFKTWKRQLQTTSALFESNKSLNNLLIELDESQKQITHMAYYDKLTGLPNRVLLVDRMQQSIAYAESQGKYLGVCYIDLDGFKEINDIWGQDTGDEVLAQIARRLEENLHPGDVAARLGGDEFVVMLGGMTHIKEIELRVSQILKAITEPVRIANTETLLTASLGVSIFPQDVGDADMLIRHANQAMYIAKRSGKNRFCIFDLEAERIWHHQHALLLRIEKAISCNEFRLHYQPKVNMSTGQVTGAEALIRWQHPERGLLGPAEFIPMAENTQLAVALGEWVTRSVLQQMSEWSERGLILPVSINISGFHLQQPGFVQRLSALLAEYPEVSPEFLQLEILETSFMEDIDSVTAIIAACGELGVTFALDDFGTGYSSLTYFRRLPTKILKIDRSFVQDMFNNLDDYALIETIVNLAHTFGRQVIAEGVETQEQGLSLLQMGCHLAQGYCIARPMPPDDIPDWIRDWEPPPVWLAVTS